MQAELYHAPRGVVTPPQGVVEHHNRPENAPVDIRPQRPRREDPRPVGVKVPLADLVHPPQPHPSLETRLAWARSWSEKLQLQDRERKLLIHVAQYTTDAKGCRHDRAKMLTLLEYSARTLDRAGKAVESTRLVEKNHVNGHTVYYRLPNWALWNMLGHKPPDGVTVLPPHHRREDTAQRGRNPDVQAGRAKTPIPGIPASQRKNRKTPKTEQANAREQNAPAGRTKGSGRRERNGQRYWTQGENATPATADETTTLQPQNESVPWLERQNVANPKTPTEAFSSSPRSDVQETKDINNNISISSFQTEVNETATWGGAPTATTAVSNADRGRRDAKGENATRTRVNRVGRRTSRPARLHVRETKSNAPMTTGSNQSPTISNQVIENAGLKPTAETENAGVEETRMPPPMQREQVPDKGETQGAIAMIQEAMRLLTQDMQQPPVTPAKFNMEFVMAALMANRDMHPWNDEGKALTFYQNNYPRFRENLRAWFYGRWLRQNHRQWKGNPEAVGDDRQSNRYTEDYERHRRRGEKDTQGDGRI